MKLIVGLGNPGEQYEGTRHNIGFQVVDRIAACRAVAICREVCDALIGECTEDDTKIVLAKPQTYMNRSGASVMGLLAEFNASPSDLLVIYDDLDLPFGRIRIRPQGGAGGHRGMASILDHLGGTLFVRVRIGIGRPAEGIEAADYVLSPFAATEADRLNGVIERAADAALTVVRQGTEPAMREFNRAD
jgi:peptidyl-tRNA hydrolase, PTH1 family